jgi:hypothetical protein
MNVQVALMEECCTGPVFDRPSEVYYIRLIGRSAMSTSTIGKRKYQSRQVHSGSLDFERYCSPYQFIHSLTTPEHLLHSIMAPSISNLKRRRDSISEFLSDPVLGAPTIVPAVEDSSLLNNTSTGTQDDDDDNYTPYVPIAKRRANLLSSLTQRNQPAKPSTKTAEDLAKEEEQLQRSLEQAEEIRREKARKERTLLEEAQEVKRKQAEEAAKETDYEREARKEAEMLAALERHQRKLASDAELAKGIKYEDSMTSS